MPDAGSFGAFIGEGSKAFLEAFKVGRGLRSDREDRAFRREAFDERKRQFDVEQNRLQKMLQINKDKAEWEQYLGFFEGLKVANEFGAGSDFVKTAGERFGLKMTGLDKLKGTFITRAENVMRTMPEELRAKWRPKLREIKVWDTATFASIVKAMEADSTQLRKTTESKRSEEIKAFDAARKAFSDAGGTKFTRTVDGKEVPLSTTELLVEAGKLTHAEKELKAEQSKARTKALGLAGTADLQKVQLEREKFTLKQKTEFNNSSFKILDSLGKFQVKSSRDLARLSKPERVELAKTLSAEFRTLHTTFPKLAAAAKIPKVFSASEAGVVERLLQIFSPEAAISAEELSQPGAADRPVPTKLKLLQTEVEGLDFESSPLSTGSVTPPAPAADVFSKFPKKKGESGIAYRKRIEAELMRQKRAKSK